MNYILIGILLFLVMILIVLVLKLLNKSNSDVITDEDVLKLKLSFSDEFNKLSEKLNGNNEKISNQLLDFKNSTNDNIIKAGKEKIF